MLRNSRRDGPRLYTSFKLLLSDENENWKDEVSKFIYVYQRANIRISKIASGAEYRMDGQFQNFLMFGILIVFEIENTLKIIQFFKL